MVLPSAHVYDTLTEEEQEELAEAWIHIYKWLKVYERITDTKQLDDEVYDFLWDTINYQHEEKRQA